MSSSFERMQHNIVRRMPERGSLDKQVVFDILDAGYLCHVAFVVDGQPFVIPTLYARSDERLLLHGSAASHMLRHLDRGMPISVAVTHVDGFVLARSAFHHSMNYRSVVLFGQARKVTDDKTKLEALKLFTDWMVVNRWDELRETTKQELRATSVLEMPIQEASAKVRNGPPKDNPEDLESPAWAGILPVRTFFGQPIPDARKDSTLVEFDLTRVDRFTR